MAHTPGPWTVNTCSGCGAFEIEAEVTVEEARSSDDSTMSELDVLHCHFVSGCYAGAVKTEADATLIAAAPDLLCAVRDCLSIIPDRPSDGTNRAVREMALAAIQKATNET